MAQATQKASAQCRRAIGLIKREVSTSLTIGIMPIKTNKMDR